MTTVLVATNGGHLAQLVELAGRIDGVGRNRLWVTFDSPQSRSLLEGQPRVFIPEIEERDVLGVCRGLGRARRILHEAGARAVVSTGSAVALAFLPLAALRGIEAHYIESSARVGAPSLTGRVLERIPGVRLYRQYPHAAVGRWRYGGSAFDVFAGAEGESRAVRRLVVTVGTNTHSFRRLLERLRAILPRGIEVFWQTGHTPVDGLDIDARPFVPAAELDRAIRAADAVIAHAGCGSALAALNAGKYPVLVVREPRYGEQIDGHQVEIARWLAERDLAASRVPEDLTFDDVVAAAARRVVRRPDPPPFQLARSA